MIKNLKFIRESIKNFRIDTGNSPEKIYLSAYELDCLNTDIQDRLTEKREHQLENSLYPNLLPLVQEYQHVNYYDYIYGVEIVPYDTE